MAPQKQIAANKKFTLFLELPSEEFFNRGLVFQAGFVVSIEGFAWECGGWIEFFKQDWNWLARLVISSEWKHWKIKRLDQLKQSINRDTFFRAQGSLRAAQAQRESGVNFSLGKSKSSSRWSLDCVARSSCNRNWLAYKSSLVSIEILASKSSDADQCRAPRETIDKKVSKIGVDFGPEGGVDGFLGQGKKGWKNSGRFRDKIHDKIRAKTRDKIRASFVIKFGTGFVPQNQKSTASSHPTFAFWALGLKDPRKTPSVRRERVGWTRLFGKKIVNELLRRCVRTRKCCEIRLEW